MASYEKLIERGENPIRTVREAMGLSMRRAAEKIGCHYQTVYMAEHGMCDPLFPTMLWWAVSNSEYSAVQIEAAFAEFRGRVRNATVEKYSLESLPVSALGTPGTDPLRSLRGYLGLSTSGFCKAFCVSVSVLHHAESVLFLPAAIQSTFQEMGVPEEIVTEMLERYSLL